MADDFPPKGARLPEIINSLRLFAAGATDETRAVQAERLADTLEDVIYSGRQVVDAWMALLEIGQTLPDTLHNKIDMQRVMENLRKHIAFN